MESGKQINRETDIRFQPRNGSIGIASVADAISALRFQPRNGSIGMENSVEQGEMGVSTPQRFDWNSATHEKWLLVSGFNPATVRLEFEGDSEAIRSFLVSTPQRFDWNAGKIGLCNDELVSTPQRFDWNGERVEIAIQFQVSTPQRFDWNQSCLIADYRHCVSTPQRFDWNCGEPINIDVALGFNPATVRLECLMNLPQAPTDSVSTPQRFDWNE